MKGEGREKKKKKKSKNVSRKFPCSRDSTRLATFPPWNRDERFLFPARITETNASASRLRANFHRCPLSPSLCQLTRAVCERSKAFISRVTVFFSIHRSSWTISFAGPPPGTTASSRGRSIIFEIPRDPRESWTVLQTPSICISVSSNIIIASFLRIVKRSRLTRFPFRVPVLECV